VTIDVSSHVTRSEPTVGRFARTPTHPSGVDVRTLRMTGLRLDVRRAGYGVAAGLAAAALGLGAAEIVAALADAGPRDSLQSPVLDVGDRVVDGVPNAVKELAIDWFGTNDKVALLAGIGIVLAVYAALVGVAALGRRCSASSACTRRSRRAMTLRGRPRSRASSGPRWQLPESSGSAGWRSGRQPERRTDRSTEHRTDRSTEHRTDRRRGDRALRTSRHPPGDGS
jgi:hypothetical protein